MKRTAVKSSASKPKKPARNNTVAILDFQAGWTQTLVGDLRQGSEVKIQYDLSRIPVYRTVHDGLPSWGMEAFVKFHPGGQLIVGSLLEHVDPATGQPLVPPRPVPLTLTVPADATAVELWFKNSDVWGHEAWDSRMGENYRFDVQPAAVPGPTAVRRRKPAK